MGAFTSGVASTPPNGPASVTVKVEPAELGQLEPIRLNALGQPTGNGLKLIERMAIHSASNRHHEAVRRLYGEADVVPLVQRDLAVGEGRVQFRHVSQCRRGDLKEECSPGEPGTCLVERREIALLHNRHGGHFLLHAREMADELSASTDVSAGAPPAWEEAPRPA